MITRYSNPAIEAIWSEEAGFSRMLQVELVHYAKLAQEFNLPAIQKDPSVNVSRIREHENTTRHETTAFLLSITEQLESEAAKWLHYGLTSSDVLDTALVLGINDSMSEVESKLAGILRTFEGLLKNTPDLEVLGRTHGQPAEPLTFHHQIQGHLDEARALFASEYYLEYGKLSGPVGTNRHLDPKIEKKALASLGLDPYPYATQVLPRFLFSPGWHFLEDITLMIERFALQVRLHQTLGEWQEPFHTGQMGSSAMPHKRNPIVAEQLTGICQMARKNCQHLSECGLLWMERDMTHSSIERVLIPDTFHLVCYALEKLEKLISGLSLNTEVMSENASKSPLSSDKLLAAIREGSDRMVAYREIQKEKKDVVL